MAGLTPRRRGKRIQGFTGGMKRQAPGMPHLIRYSERMWILCGSPMENPTEAIAMIYEDQATAWFTREDLAWAFAQGIPAMAEWHPFLLVLSGYEALYRFALGLRKMGIREIFFDLSPGRDQRAETLDGFIEELESRMRGEGSLTLN